MTQIASARNVANPIGTAPSVAVSAGPAEVDPAIYESLGVDYVQIAGRTWTPGSDSDVTYRF